MPITSTQRHTPAESVNERTSGRRIEAYQQFVAFRITETGNTDAAGKFTLTHTPVGSLSRQFDNLGRLNKEPDMVALTAADAPLYTGEFDLDNRTIKLYIDAAKSSPAENLVGAKVSYWYYAPIKGVLNADGTFTPEVSTVTTLTSSKVEITSAQDAHVVGTVQAYDRAAGASRMEVYCESGYIRVRTDGQPCTSTTGEPIAAGFAACWDVESVSVYYIQESIITVVSR